ncbi:hypothetical protein BG004_003355 [Podila humilis]|nr:hypothetical protein BG004_003355 [Podila humilis]
MPDVEFLWQDPDDCSIHKVSAHLAELCQHEYFQKKLRIQDTSRDHSVTKLLVTDFSIALLQAVLGWMRTGEIKVADETINDDGMGEFDKDVQLARGRKVARLRADGTGVQDARTATGRSTLPYTDLRLPPTLSVNSSYHPIWGSRRLDIHSPSFSWMDVYQLAATFGLSQLQSIALDKISRLVGADRESAVVLRQLFRRTYPDLHDMLQNHQTSGYQDTHNSQR